MYYFIQTELEVTTEINSGPCTKKCKKQPKCQLQVLEYMQVCGFSNAYYINNVGQILFSFQIP